MKKKRPAITSLTQERVRRSARGPFVVEGTLDGGLLMFTIEDRVIRAAAARAEQKAFARGLLAAAAVTEDPASVQKILDLQLGAARAAPAKRRRGGSNGHT